MLVLARKRGEKISIGPDVIISVERIGNGWVSLGIQAPRGVRILRTELVRNDALQEKRLTEPGDP